ncbi:hypothetical protein Tco_1482763, partial [Tanacetum coccineum]
IKDKAKVIGRGSPTKSKVIVSGSPRIKDNVHADVVKDKAHVDVVSFFKDKLAVDVVLDKVQVNVVSEKVQDDVVSDKGQDVVKKKSIDVKENSASNVVKEELPSVVKGKKSKADLPKDKPKPKPKQNVIPNVQAISEVSVLRLSNQKVNLKVKPMPDVHVLRSKETPIKRKMIYSKQDDSKKKLKVKQLKGKTKKEHSDSKLATDEVDFSSDEVDRKPKKLKIKRRLKRKRNGPDSDSSFVDEENVRQMYNKLKKGRRV